MRAFWIGCGVFVVVACGDDALGMLADAGRDAADALDSMTADAVAQPDAGPAIVTLEAPCEVESRVEDREVASDGTYISQRVVEVWATTFEVGFDPSREGLLRAVQCGPVRSVPPRPSCPDGATCETLVEGSPAEVECEPAGPLSFEPGSVRVACGHLTNANLGEDPLMVGTRWTTVRLIVSE